MSFPKWPEKHKLYWSHFFFSSFGILELEMINFRLFYIWKYLWWLLSVKSVRTLTENIWPNKLWDKVWEVWTRYGSFKKIRKSQISLVAFPYFYFRILPSKVVDLDVFLPIEDIPVASFCKSSAFICRKYMTEQFIRVSNW